MFNFFACKYNTKSKKVLDKTSTKIKYWTEMFVCLGIKNMVKCKTKL